MPTRHLPPRLNSLPHLQHKEDELGINIKGSDILNRTCKSSSHYKHREHSHAPPSSPRIRIVDELLEEPTQERIKHVDEASWRPTSAVRRLGDIALPTVEESTADVLSIARSSRMMRRESGNVENIKNLFAGLMSGELAPPVPDTRSVACSPLSNWSMMSEDLLEHVSQRVATEQQMPASSRSSLRNTRHVGLVTSRPSTASRDNIVSPHALSFTRPSSRAGSAASKRRADRPRTASARLPPGAVNRKRPTSKCSTPSRPGTAASRPGTAASRPGTAASRPGTAFSGRPDTAASRPRTASSLARSAVSRDLLSYRDSLSETGIALPHRAVEKLVSSYGNEKLSRSCSRRSDSAISNETQRSSPFYNIMRQKIHQGYADMVSAFQVYDKTNSGVLSREDFKRVLKHFTIEMNKSQIETLLGRSELVDSWNSDMIPYKTFLRKYMERGRSGYVKHYSNTSRPQSGDTEFADLAEARLFAQLHSDFVDVLEQFRSHDVEETGCVPYSDFRSIMMEYGLKVPDYRDEDQINYVDYLNSVAQMPNDTSPQSPSAVRPQTAPAAMALSHAYTSGEEDAEIQFQQLSLNLRPVHKDPRHKALVKLENCKIIKGGTRRPVRQSQTSIHGQLSRKFGSNTTELRRAMQHYDTARDGNITIGTFRDLLSEFNIKVDDNDFYHVVNTYDTGFRGLIPYKKFLTNQTQAC